MPSAISIHIGLNHVDTSAYPDYRIEPLVACVNDARSMQEIARSLQYDVTTLLCDEEATADRVIGEIGQAAYNLDPGGILLVTYSGHGGQIPDVDGDEPDGLDETWVLYDRELIDDELYNLWHQFGRDTRIVVLSDSCHSGSVTRRLEYAGLVRSTGLARHYRAPGGPRFKSIPQQAAMADFARNKARYTALQYAAGSRKRAAGIEACVLLISGCQDNQLSNDGDANGLFTSTLLEVWAGGSFAGDYRAFHKAIVQQMPPSQTPDYTIVGRQDPAMEAQVPFTVASPAAAPAPAPQPVELLQIDGPMTVPRAGPPPRFNVSVERDRYYAVEFAAESSLFKWSDPARNDANFYASWTDTALMRDAVYTLPDAVWERLRNDERLYYRVLSSSRADRWEGCKVSNGESDGEAIPAMQIVA